MLHQINLLPWRDEIRAQHKKRFIHLVILGVIIALIGQWAVGHYFHDQQAKQQARLNYLNQYIAELDRQIQSLKVAEQEHKAILTRLDVVESLQLGRNKTTDFMNLMPELIPEGVYVDKIKMNGQEIEMSGISDSTARLATMLDNLERSDSLKGVEMHSIVHNRKRFNKEFQTFKVSFVFSPVSIENTTASRKEKGRIMASFQNRISWQNRMSLQDLDVDEITEWPLLPQLLVILVLIVLIQGVGTWLYVLPLDEELQQMKQQEQTLKTTLRIKANKVAALPKLQSQLDELTSRYDYLLEQLPVQKELASMLASVNELGLDNSLTFTRIDWGQKQNKEFLYRLPLNIELTGDYHEIGDFSAAIAKLPRIISFDDVNWQRVSQESSTLHFRVRAYTYQFKSEVNDETQ